MFKPLPLVFLLTLFLLPSFSRAQTWNWATNTGTTVMGETSAEKTAIDPLNGGTYVLGEFNGSVDFGTNSIHGAGFEDVFLAKYSATGQLLWVRGLGGSEDERARGLTTDGAGNAYIALEFESPVIGVSGTGYHNAGGDSTMTNTFADLLIAKINPAGTWQWARKIGGPENDDMGGLVSDLVGNLYLAGYIWETDTLGGTTIGNVGDTFIAKLTADGTVVWVTQGGSTEDLGCTAYGLGLNAQGTELAATGCFVDEAAFGTIRMTGPMGSGAQDAQLYVARLNAATGAWTWAMQAGGESADYGTAVRIDTAGALVLTAAFTSPVFHLGPFSIQSGDTVNGYFSQGAVAKISAAGVPLWANGATSTDMLNITDLEPTRDGDYYIAGMAGDSAQFGLNVLGWPRFDNNPIVARISGATGTWQWAIPTDEIGGCGCGHIATRSIDISVPVIGDIYVASRYTDSARFGSIKLVGPLFFSSGSGQGQGYLLGMQDFIPLQTTVTPQAGQPGTPVTITGERLGTATRVTFNGADAQFMVHSANELMVTVPQGATSGLIHVTTPTGASNSPILFVVQPTAVQLGVSAITGIAPNPARDAVRVQVVPSASAVQVELKDALGRTVRNLTLQSAQAEAVLSVQGLEPGLYHLTSGGQRFKLVVE